LIIFYSLIFTVFKEILISVSYLYDSQVSRSIFRLSHDRLRKINRIFTNESKYRQLCSSSAANDHDIITEKITLGPVDLFSEEEEMMKQAGKTGFTESHHHIDADLCAGGGGVSNYRILWFWHCILINPLFLSTPKDSICTCQLNLSCLEN
jgi:hypothetical protein